MKAHTRSHAALAVVSLSLVASCTGTIGDAPVDDGTELGGVGSSTPGPTPGSPTQTGGCGIPRRFSRLNDDQYAQAVQDLVPGVTVTGISTPGRVAHEFASRSDQLPVDERLTSQLSQSAAAVGQDVIARVASFVKCAPQQTERSCAAAFIDSFVPRAFRRPLQTAEKDRLLALYDLGRADDFGTGIATIVEATLQSADFFYRTELGEDSAPQGKVVLSPYEQAAAISFYLTSSVPDVELWQAATDRSILEAPKRDAQIDRLLALPKVHENLVGLMGGWLNAHRVLSVDNPTAGFDLALRTSMHDELLRFVDSVLWGGGTLHDLFSSRKAFLDPAMAQIYGVAAPGKVSDMTMLDPKTWSGVLTRPGVVAGFSPINRSVFRGLFIRTHILCGELNPPPPTVDVNAFTKSTANLTERQKAGVRASNPSCSSCHGLMDPLGLALEHYDPIGRYVTSRDDGPVDASGKLAGTDVDGSFQDAIELSELLGKSTTVASCLVAQLAAYATARLLEDGDRCGEQAIMDRLSGTNLGLKEVIRAVATSPLLEERVTTTGGAL